MLFHDSTTKTIRTEHKHANSSISDVFDVNYPQRELHEATKFAYDGRTADGVHDEQMYLLDFAWILPSESKLFRLFPEVVTIDVVKCTNNEKRPLFTVCGKTTFGKMFTIIRVFLPHEKTWIFRWLFCVVFPRIFGLPTMK